MTLQWMVYALVASSLIGAAAWLAERGARAQLWPTRWIWTAALAGSVALPAFRWLQPTPPAAPPTTPLPRLDVLQVLPGTASAPAASGPEWGDLLLAGWAGASVLVLLFITGIGVRLWLRRRSWPPRVVDGVDVLVSKDTGPAALGLLRGRVVLPMWALALDPAQRKLLVMHEAEHVRAGDPRMAFAGLLIWALMPWNLAVAWQVKRLRLALEIDCDERVLRRSGDRRAYGSLLLEVGQRRTRLALALAEPRSLLERRIQMIARSTRKATARAVALAAGSIMLVVTACETQGPISPQAPTPEPAERVEAEPPSTEGGGKQVTLEQVQERPTFTPMTVRPNLKNPDEVLRALQSEYPPLLRDAGIGGTVGVWFLIDRTGEVRRTQLQESSGREALDEAALRVAETLQFTPAYNRDEPVPVWVAIPITFESTAESAAERAPAERAQDAPASDAERGPLGTPAAAADPGEGPTFTPMTAQPRLANSAEVAVALQNAYPPLLRDAGVTGTTNVWFFIDETGSVVRTQIAKSSGHEALDEAALRVAERMEFKPAYNGDEPVAVWVSIPLTFDIE